MILLIDNYDSFTYNLVQYLTELGADTRVYKNDALSIDDITQLRPKKIILSPGPGRPEQAGITLPTIQQFAGHIPLLGVCLGHQAIAMHFGGHIVHAKQVMHGKTSTITHTNHAMFNNISPRFTATRYHSLVVNRQNLPSELIVTASSDDDDIMAIAHCSLPIYGVQFHPESILTEHGHQLVRNFLEH